MSSSSTTAPPPAIGWNVHDSERPRSKSGSVVMISPACEFSISATMIFPLAVEIEPATTQALTMSARCCAAARQIVGQLHHLAEAMIHHRKPPVGAEHAQAVRHVVQGGVELTGERRFAETRRQRLDEDRVNAEIDALSARRKTARAAPQVRHSSIRRAAPARPTSARTPTECDTGPAPVGRNCGPQPPAV